MQAAVLERPDRELVVQQVPDPEISSREVLIEVQACGVCHTDVHLKEGFFRPLGIDVFPIIPGHEIVGIVRDVGRDVTHLRSGDRVGVYFFFSCGVCRACQAGADQACATLFGGSLPAAGLTVNGGYAQLVKAPATAVIKLPDALEFVDAAPLFCGGLTVYGALKNAGVKPSHRVAILGIGGLGHLAIPIARAMGAEVVAITGTPEKKAMAEQLGAHAVIVGRQQIGAQLLALGGADIIVSTSIDPATIADVMQGLRPRGAYVLTGMTMDPVTITPAAFAFAQQRVIGSIIGSRHDMEELLELVVRHRIRPITETHALKNANEVHARLSRNDVRLRAVLKMA